MDDFHTQYVLVVVLLTGKNVLQRNTLGGKIDFDTLSTTGKNYRSFPHLRKKILVWTESSTPSLKNKMVRPSFLTKSPLPRISPCLNLFFVFAQPSDPLKHQWSVPKVMLIMSCVLSMHVQ